MSSQALAVVSSEKQALLVAPREGHGGGVELPGPNSTEQEIMDKQTQNTIAAR